MKLSVVIPTLNEASYLAPTIDTLRARADGAPVEVLVVDGESRDGTAEVARRAGARLVAETGPATRAHALNAGARAARGDALLFLHADSRVPDGYDRLIADALSEPDVIGGAFEFKLDGPELRLRIVEFVDRVRYRVRGRFYGDQGIFVRRSAFDAIGGFPDLHIMEDARFCAAARRHGTMRLLPQTMLTSPRRFYNGGVLKTLLFDTLLWGLDLVGWHPAALARTYRKDNEERLRGRQ